MYINYIVNVICECKRLCVANSYKFMYENCAGGLLDALVIVHYMHAVYNCFYGKWCARDRGLYKEAEEQWEIGVMTGKSITGNDKHK